MHVHVHVQCNMYVHACTQCAVCVVILSVLRLPSAGVQSSHPSRVPLGVGHFQGQCPAESRTSREDEARQVLQALHGEGLSERDAGQHLPRDPPVKPRHRRPAVEEAGN